jgi:peptidoglycan/xylan/chitin deacetylase (PgdA/CDA1 family)
LPAPARDLLVDELFHRYVTTDEVAFAAELYMGLDDLRGLRDSGMYVGAHGHAHAWLDSLDDAARASEVAASIDLLELVGTATDDWVMCYPYGGYDAELMQQLRRAGCAIGLTTEPRVADLGRDDPLALPRMDTNDFSVSAPEGAPRR